MTAIEQLQTPLVGIDDASLVLILELERQDAERLGSRTKGKKREGSDPGDLEMALQLYMEELAEANMFALDRTTARSSQTASQEDARRAHKPTPTPAASSNIDNFADDADMELVENMLSLEFTNEHNIIYDICDLPDVETSTASKGAESSAWAAARLPLQPPPQPHGTHECVACGDRRQAKDVARAPCEYEYCRNCLRRLFEDSMRDETLFPPKCCKKVIPLDGNAKFLPPAVIEAFRRKTIELSTPNRTYCHRKGCSAFIPPERSATGVARCRDCGAKTCTSCKKASHGGDCPQDKQLQKVIVLAGREGWQRCPKCRTMVELDVGCNHMTCRCGAQFCYVCGATWKQCDCERWDERRLVQHARDDNNDQAAVDAGQIEGVAGNRRANHECEHPSWQARGAGICGVCRCRRRGYLLGCQRCRIVRCFVCR
ncbi:ibr finger domain protein [Apiospora rasikravindrae]|uniref:RBR-type E3 ubiquitin transferase n=1 Tax=Apiospora rasikravindrae TaxID=990691 RepID=A0ABR1U0N2_9PEZI